MSVIIEIVANPVASSAVGNVKLVHGSAIFLNEISGFPNGLVGLIKSFRRFLCHYPN